MLERLCKQVWMATALAAICVTASAPMLAHAQAEEEDSPPAVAATEAASPAPAEAAPPAEPEAAAAVAVEEAPAEEEAAAPTAQDIVNVQQNLNVVWTLIAAFLVFFMQAGFAMVESGLTRAKNVVNILMKNLMDFGIASIVFFVAGFGLMFGTNPTGLYGTDWFMLNGLGFSQDAPWSDQWAFTFLIFQTVFAGTAATIVSGAMAERTKFASYLIYSFFISLIIYPVFGSWAWSNLFLGAENGGWLVKAGFLDYAGSTVVHSVGGWLALAGALVVGPRIGKYAPDGTPKAIPGHNIALAALGVFILWFGWFGFNAGSTTSGISLAGYIAVTTNLAAAAGAVAAMITAWIVMGKPDGSMMLNGALAGLVGITAGCDCVTLVGAMCIGGIAGILVVLAVLFIDTKLKIDDPVGAVSVHGVCGVWGTLAVGLFHASNGLLYGGGTGQLVSQAMGAGAAFVWAFGCGLLLFLAIKYTVGLRVTPEEELQGLDIGEHGMEGYYGFQIFQNQ